MTFAFPPRKSLVEGWGVIRPRWWAVSLARYRNLPHGTGLCGRVLGHELSDAQNRSASVAGMVRLWPAVRQL